MSDDLKLCPKHNIFFTDSCPYCLEEDCGFILTVDAEKFADTSVKFKQAHESSYYNKQKFNWLEQLNSLCEQTSYTPEQQFITFHLSTSKLFLKAEKVDLSNLILRVTKIMESFTKMSSEQAEFSVEDSPLFSINLDIAKLSTYVTAVNDLYKQTLKAEITPEDLLLKTNSPVIEEKLSLKAWTDKLVVGNQATHNFIYQLSRPMMWSKDIESLEKWEFTVAIPPEALKKLESLSLEESVDYHNVTISPHSDGLLVRVYKYLDKEYRDLLEKNCKIKYWKNVETGDYEELVFIARRNDLDEGKTIAYVAKYFTLPVIRSFFKKNGFNVTVDPSLIKELPKLPFELVPTFKPYDIQQTAVKNWTGNDQVGTLVIPTGGGKTHAGLLTIAQLKTWTLVMVPTVEIMKQWKDFLHDYMSVPYEQMGEFWGMKKEIKPITIALFQSAHKYATDSEEEEEKLSKEEIEAYEHFGEELGKITDKFGLFLCDEGHHLAAPLWKKVAVNLKCLNRLSLTATPERYDGNEGLLFFTMGDVVYKVTYGELAEKKIVSPIRFKKIEVELSPTEKTILTLMGEFKFKKNTGYGGTDSIKEEILEQYVELPYIKAKEAKYYEDWNKKLAKGKVKEIPPFEPKNISVRIVHSFAENKFKQLEEILKNNQNSKILVFNEFVAGTKLIHDKIKEVFPSARILTGSTPYEERQDIFQNFKDSNSGCIITTTVLDEGIDVPDCNTIVIFNGRKRRRQMIQRIGRGCRFGKFKVENVYELVTCRESKVAQITDTEDIPKTGETLYIIGGQQGNIGDAVTLVGIANEHVFVKGPKGEDWDKLIQNLSRTPHGLPLSVPKSQYSQKYGKQAEINKLLDYESNVSDERNPGEILEFEKQEKLIKDVEALINAQPKCAVTDCNFHVLTEKTTLCNYHYTAKEALKLISEKMHWNTLQEMFTGLQGTSVYGGLNWTGMNHNDMKLMLDITHLLADRSGIKLA